LDILEGKIMQHVSITSPKQDSSRDRELTAKEIGASLTEVEERLPLPDFQEIANRASTLLEGVDELDTLVESMASTGHWECVLPVMLQHGTRLLAQGHAATLRRWIGMSSSEFRAREPWLTYWSGAASISDNPVFARGALENAWGRFEERADRTGQLLTATCMLESYQFEWSSFAPVRPWIDRLAECIGSESGYVSRDAELRANANLLLALTCVQTESALSSRCIARLRPLLDSDLDVNHRLFAGRSLLLAYCSTLDVLSVRDMARRLQDLLQEPGSSPNARASTLNAVAYGLWLDCAYEGSENALREAANTATSFPSATPDPLHLHTRHLLAFARRDRNEMAECVHAMRQAINPTWHHGMTMFSQALAEQALLRGDLAAAARHWSCAVTGADAACAFPLQWASRLALAGCRAAQSDCAGAAIVLQQARGLFAEELSEDSVRDDTFLTAYLALRRADRSECHRLLGSALRAAPLPGGASRLFHILPAAMADLCMQAMHAEIGIESVRSLVEHYRLPPPAAAGDDWPWPFKVYVFGSFHVLKGDAPIRFSRRTQKKTLELLQALIAFGGTDVAATSLTDALWPDSDGDAGYHNLESALYRLRLLLGAPGAVTMAGSKLTLDRRYFWVDMWAFERELHANAERGADAAVRFAGIRELYRGHFLEQDSDKPWALKARQIQRDKFLRSIRDAARVYENRRLWEEAANVYQVGIELDGMAEDLYRGLMICHRELGEHTEVLQVYRRCREFLIKVLGVQPNPKTEAIYHSVRQSIVAQTG
jgi:LuxR family transcriptional regulator, maltose regulon positive regulatory protein